MDIQTKISSDLRHKNRYTSLILFLILIIIALPLFIYELGDHGIISKAEARTAVTAREMIQNDDYILPTLNGEPRLEKPPLYYWLVALTAKRIDELDEKTARLPSALFGFFTIILIFFFTKNIANKLYEEGKTKLNPSLLGFLSAFMLLTTSLFYTNARKSEVNITLSFFITLAVFLLYKYLDEFEKAPKRRLTLYLLLAYISMGFGVLTKGPITFVIPLLPFLIISIMNRRERSRPFPTFSLNHILGWIIMILMIAPWLILIFYRVKSQGSLLFEEVLVRFTKGTSHKKIFLYYIPVILFGFFPWAIFIIQSLIAWFKNEKSSPHRYLFYVFIINFIWLSIMFSKESHYILPIFTILPIFIIYYLYHNQSYEKKSIFALNNKIFFILIVISSLVLIILGFFFQFYVILALTLLLLIAYIIIKKNTKFRQFFSSPQNIFLGRHIQLISLLLVLELAYIAYISETINIYEGTEYFTKSFKRNIPKESSVVYYKEADPVFLFYYKKQLPTFDTFDKIKSLSQSGSDTYIVADTDIEEFKNDTDFIPVKSYYSSKGKAKFGIFLLNKSLINKEVTYEDFIKKHSPVRIIALSDTGHEVKGIQENVNEIMNLDLGKNLDAILLAGDNMKAEYYNIFNVYRHFLKPFSPLLKMGVPIYAALGNHDVSSINFQINFKLFNMKGQRYYTVNLGKDFIDIFILDPMILQTQGEEQEKELKWLTKELAKSIAQWKIVIMHFPIYTSSNNHDPNLKLRMLLAPLFAKYGVNIVLAGHNHIYQRTVPIKGIIYFVDGIGSKIDDEGFKEDPLIAFSYDKNEGFIYWEFSYDKMNFKAIDKVGNVFDKGTIKKLPNIK